MLKTEVKGNHFYLSLFNMIYIGPKVLFSLAD